MMNLSVLQKAYVSRVFGLSKCSIMKPPIVIPRIQGLTDEQIETLTEAFALLDRDDHGKIHYRELGVVLKSIGLHADDVQLKAMIKECAGPKNDHVDLVQFLTSMGSKFGTQTWEADIEAAFHIIDKDKNGYISPSEIRYLMVNLGEKITDEELYDLVALVDTNGDGHISLKEFKNAMMEM